MKRKKVKMSTEDAWRGVFYSERTPIMGAAAIGRQKLLLLPRCHALFRLRSSSRVPSVTIIIMFLLLLLYYFVSCFGFSISNKHPTRFTELLPKDLDLLFVTEKEKNHNSLLVGALGVQLLLLGGWKNDRGKSRWEPRPKNNNNIITTALEERLAFLTPSWKGGSLDYDLEKDGSDGIFQQGSQLLKLLHSQQTYITTLAQLADLLQDQVGVAVRDYDNNSMTKQAMQAMFSWNIPKAHITTHTHNFARKEILLLIFSFGSNQYCMSPSDCPRGPGGTNELLAATAIAYVQDLLSSNHNGNIHIVAQWEVYTALQDRHYHNETALFSTAATTSFTLTSVGTPGSYETTSDIFERMLCHWYQHHGAIRDAILLAHPDHLRRVWWTSETLRQKRQNKSHTQEELGGDAPSCGISQEFLQTIHLVPAMTPYSTNWHNLPKHDQQHLRRKNTNINLFATLLEPAQVHINGQPTRTTWYDDEYLGFFPDSSNPQKWTQDRRIWILYDQWAVLKGIVTGIIDIDSIDFSR